MNLAVLIKLGNCSQGNSSVFVINHSILVVFLTIIDSKCEDFKQQFDCLTGNSVPKNGNHILSKIFNHI